MMQAKEREFRLRVSMYLDGDLDAESTRVLSEELKTDAAAAKIYAEMAAAHSELVEQYSSGMLLPTYEQSVVAIQSGRLRIGHGDDDARAQRVRYLYGLIAVCAALWGVWALAPLGESVDGASGDDFEIAQILRKIDCDWETDSWGVGVSDKLLPGQTVSIARGLMEVGFSSGAVVTLEGPVSFRVASPMRCVLFEGRLTAQVPESASGFTVETPAGQAVDLGTKFGIDVGNDGSTETHVFEGEVVMKPLNSPEVHLTDDMALRLDSLGDPQPPRAASQGFIQPSFAPVDGIKKPSVDRNLALWFSADGPKQVDEQGRIIAWADIRSSSNDVAESAWQVDPNRRPVWVKGAIGGHSALRFTGSESLTTEPVELGKNLSLVIVAEPSELFPAQPRRLSYLGRQILNLNGPPHLMLGVDPEHAVACRGHLGLSIKPDGSKRRQNSGSLNSRGTFRGEPFVATYVYDSDKELASLSVNRSAVTTTSAEPFVTTATPRRIGGHPLHSGADFVGHVAEIMVFDTALSDEEVDRLMKDMLTKYSISIALNDR